MSHAAPAFNPLVRARGGRQAPPGLGGEITNHYANIQQILPILDTQTTQ